MNQPRMQRRGGCSAQPLQHVQARVRCHRQQSAFIPTRTATCRAHRQDDEPECSQASERTTLQTSTQRGEVWRAPSGSPSVLLSTLAAAGFGGLLGLFPDLSGPSSAIQAVLILCGIVAFHELGHFTAARSQGIHVSKFSIGFGPKLLSYQPGEVEYAVRALPLGGFVAFPDNDEDCPYPDDDPNLLKNRPVLDRAIVISMGTPPQATWPNSNVCGPQRHLQAVHDAATPGFSLIGFVVVLTLYLVSHTLLSRTRTISNVLDLSEQV